MRSIFLLLASFYVPLVAHECGHLMGGLLQGWHLRRFAIYPVALDRVCAPDTKRWHFVVTRLQQAGQCNLDPPFYDEMMFRRYFWYVAGGPLFGALVTLLLIGAVFLPTTASFHGFLIAASMWGVYLNGTACLPVFGESDGRSLARLRSELQGRQFAALMYASVRQRHEGSELFLPPKVLNDMTAGYLSDPIHLATLSLAYYYYLHHRDTASARIVLRQMRSSAEAQGTTAVANVALEQACFIARFDPSPSNLSLVCVLLEESRSGRALDWQAPQARARSEAALLIGSGLTEAARTLLTPLITEETRSQGRYFKHLYGQVVARDIIEMHASLPGIDAYPNAP